MDAGALTPTQQEAATTLLAPDQPRPQFSAGLRFELLDQLELALTPAADRLGDHQLNVNKGALSRVLACEAHHVAVEAEPFAWSPATARGTVVHRALQMAVFRTDQAPPLDLVDEVIERMAAGDDDWTPGEWLRHAPPAERAELRGDAAAVVTAFQELFPPLKPAWRPRMEAPVRVELCGDRIRLRAKVDLALGRPRDTEARTLLVDFKTGGRWGGHLDDLRFYALLETLRVGVPPFRIAAFYLDAGRWHHEDVSEELLRRAADRVIAGVDRLVDLGTGARAPTITSGPSCGWCPQRATCPGARQWEQALDDADDPSRWLPVATGSR